MFGQDAEIPTDVRTNVVMAKIQPGARMKLPVFDGGCFVYPIESSLQVEGTAVPEKQLAILNHFSGEIVIENSGKIEAKVIFGNAERIEGTKDRWFFLLSHFEKEPWVKLLTQNGFLIARDEAEAKHQEELSKKQGLAKYGIE